MFELSRATTVRYVLVLKTWETNHLLRYHDYSLCRESSVAVVEKVFEGRAEEVNDEDIVKAFLTEVIDIRYAGYQISAWSAW